MSLMKAAVLNGLNLPLEIVDIKIPELKPNEALVKLKAAALNHRDVWIQKGQYAGIVNPIILGSDGCGVVEKTGSKEFEYWLNKEVIINPSLNWGNNPRVQAKDYVILGTPHNGTFAQYVKISVELLHEKPNHLSFEQAAAFPLAGLTAYRALFGRAKALQGETVLITGIGGGVALFAAQFAIAAGCKVYVTSSSIDKIDKAISIGAIGGAIYTQPEWHKQLSKETGGFDVIIDGAGGDNFAKLVDLAKPAARIAMYGATAGGFNSGVPAKIFWKQLDILGSTMGNNEEFNEMVKFINQHQIVPVVSHSFNLAQANEAMLLMDKGGQFGKIVLNIPQ
ncbi:MAG: zinc-binding dehydrogenase [Bacteroidia bacterium]